MSIELLIADDDMLVRLGLEAFFAGTEVRIVAQAANADEAVRLALEHCPHVLLLDARLAAGDARDGLAALEPIRTGSPTTRAVLFSASDNPTYVARAVALGATDFLPKTAGRKVVVAAVRAAAGNSSRPSPRMARIAANLTRTEGDAGLDASYGAKSGLSRREWQIVRHLAYGLSNREIALSLKIHFETVKEHVKNAMKKLHVTDRTQAAVWALRNRFVEW
jgi:DNA-binding NarL/FixJ family response regulator